MPLSITKNMLPTKKSTDFEKKLTKRVACCGTTPYLWNTMEDNQGYIDQQHSISIADMGVLAVYSDLSNRLKERVDAKAKLKAKYESEVAKVDADIVVIRETVKGLQIIYDPENYSLPNNLTTEVEVDFNNESPVDSKDFTVSSNKADSPVIEEEPRPGGRGALRFAIVKAVSVEDDFLTNDEVYDFLSEHFAKHEFVKRNVISGLKDARQAKALIGIQVDGHSRISFLHGLPEFFDDAEDQSTIKSEYLEKFFQKLEYYGLTLPKEQEGVSLEPFEKKLPPALTGGNVETETDREKPSIDVADKINNQPSGQLSLSNSY